MDAVALHTSNKTASFEQEMGHSKRKVARKCPNITETLKKGQMCPKLAEN